tara:strand:- start:5477 stop:6226 length:750 start_codon:yes stop_codon:yes gene_type:complete
MNDSGVHKLYRSDDRPFTMLPNEAVRNPKMTSNAFRLLAYLMSHEDGYDLRYEQIERQTSMGRHAINKAADNLADLGWLQVDRPRDDNNRFLPKSWTLLTPSSVTFSTVEPSHMEQFHSGKDYPLKKNTNKEEHLEEKNNDLEIEFDEFWDVYPKKADKRVALKSYKKALSRVDALTIYAGAVSYRDDPNREQAYTKNASTWLNADAWDNEPLSSKSLKITNNQKNLLLIQRMEAQERLALEGGTNEQG